MNLLTVEYLRAHGLTALVDRFKLEHRRHLVHPNLVLFKYNQIESPMAEPICQECRGLILDEAANWRIVSYFYKKFFNFGEGQASQIDWLSATVLDKLDGSFVGMWNYRGEWHVSTLGVPDASGETHFGMSFRDLFWNTWNQLGYHMPFDPDYCYCFELMTPLNRVVVQHQSAKIVLHGARNIKTLLEASPQNIALAHGWQCVRSFSLKTINDVIAAASQLKPTESEGYVVCDRNFNRIKIKSPQYVALHHLKESLSARRLLEIIRTNDQEEFLIFFPEFEPYYRAVKERLDDLCRRVTETYDRYKDIPIQKDFALKVKDMPFAGMCFSLRRGQSLAKILAEIHIRTLEGILKLEELDFSNLSQNTLDEG